MQVSIQLKDAIGCEVTVAGYIAAWVKANMVGDEVHRRYKLAREAFNLLAPLAAGSHQDALRYHPLNCCLLHDARLY